MLTYEILLEHYVNTFTTADKEKYVDEVWDVLQKSYAKVGGLKSGGLETKEGLIKNTAMWKLLVNNGKIKVVFIYKDKGGRKKIATGTDKSIFALRALAKMLIHEFERSYSEVSDDFERFLISNLPTLVKKYQIPFTEVQKIIKDDEIKPSSEDEFHYERKIGNEWHTKMMIGTPGKKFY